MKAIVAVMAVLAMAIPALAQDSGWIGISIGDQPDRGVLVRRVEANSPAEKAGLKANDVIVQFNRQEVVGVQQLTRLVNETPVGRSVDIVVRRDNQEQTLKVTSEKSPLAIGPFHIQTPNFEVFREPPHTFEPFQQFQVMTSVSMTQAGIRTDSLTPQLREFFGVKGSEGVLVASVDANSGAARAGLLAGDVITAVEGRSVSSPQDFTREVRAKSAAVVFSLKIVRNKQEREIRVER